MTLIERQIDALIRAAARVDCAQAAMLPVFALLETGLASEKALEEYSLALAAMQRLSDETLRVLRVRHAMGLL
jgi:hypothetical protein